MATKGRSKPERIARWKVMTVGVEPQLGELPLLAPLHTELKSITLQSEELDARSEALKAETQEINRKRDDLATRGDELRNRMAAALQTVHGFRSEKLLEFGIQPRRARGRDLKTRKRRSQPAAPSSSQ
jgi:FtsZ-binding cell division protein ZapB